MGNTPEGQAQGPGLQQRFRVKRWNVIAGICLINGYRLGTELGVHTGRFSVYLCGLMPEMHINAVDLWQIQPPRIDEGAETYDTEPHEENLQRLRDFNQDNLGGRINILRMSTLVAASLVADQTQDFVFIDADHTEEGCRADIEAWTPKVRPGGLICGHDYNWPSVKRAVLATGGNIIKESDNVWLRFIP